MASTTKQKSLLYTRGPNIDANYGPWNSIQEYTDWLTNTVGLSEPYEGTVIAVKSIGEGNITKYIFENKKWREDIKPTGIPIYSDDQIKDMLEVPSDYIEIPDTRVLGREVSPGESYIRSLFSAIRALQAEVLKLKNSFNLGINSCVNDETASSRILYDLDDVEEEEPLWAVQESELSELYSLDFSPENDLKVTPGSYIVPSQDNNMLEVIGTAYWEPTEDLNIKNLPDAKTFLYLTTSEKDVNIHFINDSEEEISFSLKDALGNLTTKYPSYAIMLAVSKKVKDTISNKAYGNSFVWLVVQDLIHNNTLYEKYINPFTGEVSDTTVLLPENIYINKVEFTNTKISKFDLYSKYQDFSDHVDAVKPSDIDSIKYKAAHITIRSVDSTEQLDKLIRKFQTNELVYVTESNSLYIIINGIKHKIGSGAEPTPEGDTMTTQELLRNLIEQGLISLKGAEYDDNGNLIAVDDIELNKIASLGFINEATGDSITYSTDSEGNLIGYNDTPENYKFSYIVDGEYLKAGAKKPIVTVNGERLGLEGDTPTRQRGFIARIHGDNVSASSKDIGLNSDRVKIGSFYSPNTETKIYGCSHAFIELENSAQNDYYLDDCYLHFAAPIEGINEAGDKIYTQATYHVALRGKIPAGGTYLIRGFKYADENLPSTFINVNTFDTEWYVTPDTVTFTPATGYDYSHNFGKLLRTDFINEASDIIYGIALTYKHPDVTYSTRLVDNTDKLADTLAVVPWVIDCINMFISSIDKAYWNCINNKGKLNIISKNIGNAIYKNTFELDPAKQAFQSFNTKDSSRLRGVTAADNQIIELDNEYIQFPNSNDIYPVTKFTPKASFEKKNIITDKTSFDFERPNMVTCSFGINQNTRCFNWISAGDYEEFIWTRVKGNTDWERNQSYWGNKVGGVNFVRKEFEQQLTFNGETRTIREIVYANPKQKNIFPGSNIYYTSHKCIIDIIPEANTEPIICEYIVGRSNSDGTPMEGHISDIQTFTIYPNTYKPVIYQTSDQQGFHWIEYQAWAATAKVLNNKINDDCFEQNIIPILLNTGDMTQNGTRINEWLDYYNGGKCLFNHLEQMNIVGNNDLGNVDETMLGTGDDPGKSNPHFYNIAYCYEIPICEVGTDAYTPIYCGDSGPKYIPSIYYFDVSNFRIIMFNSEITSTAGNALFGSGKYDIYTGYLWDEDPSNNTSDVTTEYKPVTNATLEFNNKVLNANHYIYEVLYQWIKESRDKKVIFACHEMPFTVVTLDNIDASTFYSDRSISVVGASTGLIGSHANRNTYNKSGSESKTAKLGKDMKLRSKGTYWLSRLLENFGVKYCFGGHKHTYACTWPIRENYYYTKDGVLKQSLVDGRMEMPASLVDDTVNFFSDGTTAVIPTIGNDTIGSEENMNTYINLTKKPIAAAKNFDGDSIKGAYGSGGEIGYGVTIEKDIRDDQNYVVYFMLQASGFKLKSNKELPGTLQKFSQIIPETDTANSKPSKNQIYPMIASIALDLNKYDTGLDISLMAIKNIVPNDTTEVFNQQSVKLEKWGCMNKPKILYFNNIGEDANVIPYGAQKGKACWTENSCTLNLHI